MDIREIFEFIVAAVLFVFGWWMYFSWLNSRFNDEDKDVTDAWTPDEYIFRKIIRFFKRSNNR